MRKRLIRHLRLIRYAALGIIVIAGSLAHGGTRADAVQAQPATAASFYVETSNPKTIATLGCNQGHRDAATLQGSEVILDFGVQWSDNSRTTTINGINLSIAQIENMVEQFAIQYYYCTGSDITTTVRLGIGTNNSTGAESSSMGSGWAGVVVAVQNWLTNNGYENTQQEAIVGANDIEAAARFSGTGSQPKAINWANGFTNHGGAVYVNYGSADGCPPYGSCVNGWTQAGTYQVSWGIRAAYVLPEIYYAVIYSGDTKGGQPSQWAQIAVYGHVHYGGYIQFDGPLDEHDLATSTLTSAQAWTDFWNALNKAGMDTYMGYSAEIHRTATN